MKGYFIAKNSFETEVTFKKIISECFEYSKKKIHYGERLKQVAPTTLLKYFPIMVNFLEVFQEFIKHNFKSDGNTSGGCDFFFYIIVANVQFQEFLRTIFLSPGRLCCPTLLYHLSRVVEKKDAALCNNTCPTL